MIYLGNLSSNSALIELRNVSKTYQKKRGIVTRRNRENLTEATNAVDDICLDVKEGEFVTIVGPSGCGKTTLLMMISGIITASSGTIRINSANSYTNSPRIGMVFQSPVLFDWRSVLDNVLLPVEVLHLTHETYLKRAEDLLRMTGLYEFRHRYPRELSGGMQQRVAICRALVHEPSIVLMDEPFASLDALARDQMNIELQKIWQKSTSTIIFVTHNVQEAVLLGDRVIVMTPRPGKIAGIMDVALPRPRTIKTRNSDEFGRIVAPIYEKLGVTDF